MIYVLTRSINQYDQDGDYFVHAWTHKPSMEELKKVYKLDDEVCELILAGKSTRRDYEYEWYGLEEIEE